MKRKLKCHGCRSGALVATISVLILGAPCWPTLASVNGPSQATSAGAGLTPAVAEGSSRAAVDQPGVPNPLPVPVAGQPVAYPTTGIIDPLAVHNSEAPGELVPLAQAQSSVNHWMEAVDAAGPATPLSDPSFEGTVFIPDDEAFETAYPQLKPKASGAETENAFANVRSSVLSGQLNSLTVPGPKLKLEQLDTGKVLRTADGGSLKVLGARPEDGAARLEHTPSGTIITVLEPNLQSGSAIGHIVDTVTPGAAVPAAERSPAGGPGGRYASAMAILLDPVQKLSDFAGLVQQAGLAAVLSNPESEITLFAPANQAMQLFLGELATASMRALATNSSLADQIVSAQMVSGVAMGSKALEALLPDGELKTQAGTVLLVQQQTRSVGSRPPAAAGAVIQEKAAAHSEPVLTIGGATITSEDLIGGKSVVHIIDKVLVPPDAAQQLNIPMTAVLSNSGSPSGHGEGSAAAPSAGSSAVPAAAIQLACIAAAAVAFTCAMVPAH